MRWLIVIGIAAAAIGAGAAGRAVEHGGGVAEAPAARGEALLTLVREVEDGTPMLVARLTSGGVPVAGAELVFVTRRLYGDLTLGRDRTLDDGSAAVPFPAGLPGDDAGFIPVRVLVESPGEFARVSGEARIPGGAVIEHESDPFPRALWSPKAPLPLIVTIAVLIGGVWLTYATVLIQFHGIWKGRK